MKQEPLPPILNGIALGGPYCGIQFRTPLRVIPLPGGDYHQTERRDSQKFTVFQWKPLNKTKPSHLK